MKQDKFRRYCLSKKGVTEEYPFDEVTQVFKVKGKIFAITVFDFPLRVNLKCDPERAAELRERHEDIVPGYHMNKKHWNTVNFEGKLSDKELESMINSSYELVVSGLNKKLKEELNK